MCIGPLSQASMRAKFALFGRADILVGSWTKPYISGTCMLYIPGQDQVQSNP